MDIILSHALSFFGLVNNLVSWAAAHPEAAAFYALLINTIMQKLPYRGADDVLSIVGKALKSVYDRKISGNNQGGS